ncbi:hypothetical protein BT96DRAFT_986608 [Gymnopus androsaceus JB14]|uniref:Uncharacterized protein n=1 Tax=Gymnopus androsaceus JB14 TaxID=1447944 RepID=A0A6A4I9M8_9AGAR|nr:hypothetical protein BT96DRAFT_986608 [Gymnopus androsaceus JB14]
MPDSSFQSPSPSPPSSSPSSPSIALILCTPSPGACRTKPPVLIPHPIFLLRNPRLLLSFLPLRLRQPSLPDDLAKERKRMKAFGGRGMWLGSRRYG